MFRSAAIGALLLALVVGMGSERSPPVTEVALAPVPTFETAPVKTPITVEMDTLYVLMVEREVIAASGSTEPALLTTVLTPSTSWYKDLQVTADRTTRLTRDGTAFHLRT